MELLSRGGRSACGRSAALKVPLGSAHRILLDLGEESVVERTPAGEWELSYGCSPSPGCNSSVSRFPQLARPVIEKLAEATAEPCI